ncbi:MAG: hypothetical protein AAGA85_09555 [Bacteroidota bacterium]
MKELLEFSIVGVNIIPTGLLIFVLLYWLVSMIGVIDSEALDIDLDVDADLDADASFGGASVLSFFNIGDMPLMIFVSFFTFPLWAITLIVNDFLGISAFLGGLPIFLGAFVVSLFIAKFLTYPIAKIFRKAKQNTEALDNIVGQVCIAKLPISNSQAGQAEIKVGGTAVLINARTNNKGAVVQKGDRALVIDFDEAGKFYFVEPYS